MAQKHEILFKRGTAAWSVKRYKEFTLTRLIQDLKRLEEKGLDTEVCNKIKEALNEAVNLSSSLPNESLFCVNFWQELENFRDEYLKWNDVQQEQDNQIIERRKRLKKLIERRRKMWEAFRKQVKLIKNKNEKDKQMELLTQLDKKLMNNMHFAFKDVIDNHPELFPSLKKELKRFEKLSKSPI